MEHEPGKDTQTRRHGDAGKKKRDCRAAEGLRMAKVTIRFHETAPARRRKMLRDLAKRVNANESLEELITEMREFEDKYGMSTVEFYARFVAGKMGDSRDFIKWAGIFDRYHRLVQRCFPRQTKAA
ncbi:MAG: hypothetical protein ACRERD_32395 [Candidatus Binatia bacterium]